MDLNAHHPTEGNADIEGVTVDVASLDGGPFLVGSERTTGAQGSSRRARHPSPGLRTRDSSVQGGPRSRRIVARSSVLRLP